ncbi:MAG: hypothetical protein FWC70_06950 [Defluviitaleaceae bacterium]|nr:hypothetical protein [Defluviitaleaceae bacterium]
MSKRGILIELTPLLDVILIMMFLILVQSEGRVDAVYTDFRQTFEEDLAAAQAQLEEDLEAALAEAISEFEEYHAEQFGELDNLRQQVADFDALMLGMDEDSGILTVNLNANPQNLNMRYVTVESPGHDARIDLTWDALARDDAAREINAALAAQIRAMDNAVVFVVFMHDGRTVFTADHRLVWLAIHNQRLHNPNVFTVELDIRQ